MRRLQLCLCAGLVLMLAACSVFDVPTELHERTRFHETVDEINENKRGNAYFDTPSLTLMSLNLAHGRQSSFSQLLLNENQIQKNLQEIAVYLKHINADVVALQEADGPSSWSGGFDHVHFLMTEANYTDHRRSTHVDNLMGDYGTAILSKASPQESFGVTFLPSPPTPRKGFTLASFLWKPTPTVSAVAFDVISVHLDFSRDSVRKEQIQELRTVLRSRNKPTIIMGDFNSEWLARDYVVDQLSEFGWHAFEPNSTQYATYKKNRLDWVLLSKEFEFFQYKVDDVALSDHRPVITTIEFKDAYLIDE